MASHDMTVAPDLSAIAPLNEWVEERCQEAGLGGELGKLVSGEAT